MAARTFTDEELQAAYRERRRHDWPAYADAMNDRTYHALIVLEAGQRARYREQRQQPARPQNQPQAHHQPRPTRSTLVVPSTPPVFDHKRRAAGERDDD